jgi:hypothetical protein
MQVRGVHAESLSEVPAALLTGQEKDQAWDGQDHERQAEQRRIQRLEQGEGEGPHAAV